ncbi:MAG: UDP-3-O-acyl-N-acetylglucosamine deacetylase [Phycisphaerales bacterium]
MNAPRRTPRQPATIRGRGLFTAAPATLTIRPAKSAQGLVFARDNDRVPVAIASLSTDPIHPAFASLPPRCTCLRGADASPPIATVEHVLAALGALGVTDATLELDGPEVPIDDGSAAAFVDALLAVGLEDLAANVEMIRPTREIRVEGDLGASITISPSDHPKYVYDLDYGPASPIPAASVRWSGDPDDFATSVAPARTFCLRAEAEAMTALGLFKNLSPRDMLVIGEDGPIDNDYRLEDEPARHKLLDLVGDLALVGSPLCARVHAVRSGHALNHAAARAILDSLA